MRQALDLTRPWRISPSLRLRLIADDYLRIERADQEGQWFLMPAHLAGSFLETAARLRRKVAWRRSLPGGRLLGQGECRFPVTESFSLFYDWPADEVVVFNSDTEVLRLQFWELPALCGGVSAAFGEMPGFTEEAR
jgi:hypothetical protein